MVHSPRTYTSHKPFQGGQPWKLWADTTTTPHYHGASCTIFRSTITMGMNLIKRLIEIALFQRAQSLCAYIAPLSLSTYLRDSKGWYYYTHSTYENNPKSLCFRSKVTCRVLLARPFHSWQGSLQHPSKLKNTPRNKPNLPIFIWVQYKNTYGKI